MAEALAPSYRGSYDELALTARWPSAKPKPEVPTAALPPIAIKGRVLAQITDYDGLWSAMRGRVDELRITREELDYLSGNQDGYSGKLLGPAQVKKFGKQSLGKTLRGTGCYLVLVEDPEQTEKMMARAKRRKLPLRPTPRFLNGASSQT
jgi:hypothetical protein